MENKRNTMFYAIVTHSGILSNIRLFVQNNLKFSFFAQKSLLHRKDYRKFFFFNCTTDKGLTSNVSTSYHHKLCDDLLGVEWVSQCIQTIDFSKYMY